MSYSKYVEEFMSLLEWTNAFEGLVGTLLFYNALNLLAIHYSIEVVVFLIKNPSTTELFF